MKIDLRKFRFWYISKLMHQSSRLQNTSIEPDDVRKPYVDIKGSFKRTDANQLYILLKKEPTHLKQMIRVYEVDLTTRENKKIIREAISLSRNRKTSDTVINNLFTEYENNMSSMLDICNDVTTKLTNQIQHTDENRLT